MDAAGLPDEARMVALKGLDRLNQMPPMAPEVGIIRTYIDWIVDLPWSNSTPDNLDVKNAEGQAQTWALEATSVAGLQRSGVTRETLKPGDPIKVRCHPLRDGSRGCLLGFVKTRDGKVTDWDGTNLPIPRDL